jgi:hypothetical protein
VSGRHLLKVWWQDATLFVYFDFITYIHSFNHNTFIRRHSLKLLSISSSLVCSVGKLPCGAEPRIELGLQSAIFLFVQRSCECDDKLEPDEPVQLQEDELRQGLGNLNFLVG